MLATQAQRRFDEQALHPVDLTGAGLTGLIGAGLTGAGAHAQGRFVERALHLYGMHALQSNASPRAFRRTGRGPRPRAFR